MIPKDIKDSLTKIIEYLHEEENHYAECVFNELDASDHIWLDREKVREWLDKHELEKDKHETVIDTSHCNQPMVEVDHPGGMDMTIQWERLFVCLYCGHIVSASGQCWDDEDLENLKEHHEELKDLNLEGL